MCMWSTDGKLLLLVAQKEWNRDNILSSFQEEARVKP
jgi:hypothetical protein